MILHPSAGLRTLAAVALATAFSVAGAAKPEFPPASLPEAAGGQRAIDLLGAQLPAVARWYGKTPQEFASILRRDRSARLDRQGRLHYIDTQTVEPATTATDPGVAGAAPYPADQTFLLHSRPGAQRTIYLDFNGYTAIGTAWNSYVGLGTIDSPPYDLDGVPYSFSQTELARIQGIWQRVAEDYAPFDVDVTTEEPAAEALTRSSSSDPFFGTRIVITRDFVPGGCGCGGFGYVGVFDLTTDYYKPAYVFYDHLGNGNEKYVAEAATHEAGHNVGLNHDGSSTTAYYAGHGSGATGWAPIMGVGYGRSLVQWSKGEYPDANNLEDDFVVMQANALPLRTDDHGGTIATATTMAGSSVLSSGGVIERRADTDVFRFVAAAGPASFSLVFTSPSPNLDARLDLLDGTGAVLATANPADALGATLSASLPATGTYYLRVDGVGKGSLADGYSDYGSLGEYVLTGGVQIAGNQPPQAVATATPSSGAAPLAVVLSGAGSADPEGGALDFTWDFGDGSAPATGATVQHVYAQGSYTATLRVTDSAGLSATSAVAIRSDGPVATAQLHVHQITVTLSGNRNNAAAVAEISVRDQDGNPVGGAVVGGTWSGATSGTSSGTTDSSGLATLRSSRVRSRGTFTISVTDVSLSSYVYAPEQNLETSDSVTR